MNNFCKSCSQNTEYPLFISPAKNINIQQQIIPQQIIPQQITPQQKFIIQNTTVNKPIVYNQPNNNTQLMEYIVQSQHNNINRQIAENKSKCSTCSKIITGDNSILYYGCGATCTLPPTSVLPPTPILPLINTQTVQKPIIKSLNIQHINKQQINNNTNSTCKTCNKVVQDVQTGQILYYGCGATCTLPSISPIIQPYSDISNISNRSTRSNDLYQIPIYYHGCGASCNFPYGSCANATIHANSNPYFFHNKNKSTSEKYRFIKLANNPKKVITHKNK